MSNNTDPVDTNNQTNSKKDTGMLSSGIEFDRRDLIKTSAVLFSLGTTTSTAVSVIGKPVTAQSVGDGSGLISITNDGGGGVNDVYLDGNTEFGLTWDGLIRGDIIDLQLRLTPTHISTPGSDPSFIGDTEVIGKMGYQVETGSKDTPVSISGSEFFTNREKKSVTAHGGLTTDNLSVNPDTDVDIYDDGEDEFVNEGIKDATGWDKIPETTRDEITNSGDYIRIVVLKLQLMASYPGEDFTEINSWNLFSIVRLTGGFGINFGNFFGTVDSI